MSTKIFCKNLVWSKELTSARLDKALNRCKQVSDFLVHEVDVAHALGEVGVDGAALLIEHFYGLLPQFCHVHVFFQLLVHV